MKKMSPKSLENLRPIKKGSKGLNPLGGGAHNPAGRVKTRIKRLNVIQVKKVIDMVAFGNWEELNALSKSKTDPFQLRWLATAAIEAERKGDVTLLERLWDRVIGKSLVRIDFSKSDSVPETEAELKAELARYEKISGTTQ